MGVKVLKKDNKTLLYHDVKIKNHLLGLIDNYN